MPRGVEIEFGGKVRTIKLGYAAIATAERKAGMSLNQMLSEQHAGISTNNILLWAGIRHGNVEDRGLTLERLEAMVDAHADEGGDMGALYGAVVDALLIGGMRGNSQAGTEGESPIPA